MKRSAGPRPSKSNRNLKSSARSGSLKKTPRKPSAFAKGRNKPLDTDQLLILEDELKKTMNDPQAAEPKNQMPSLEALPEPPEFHPEMIQQQTARKHGIFSWLFAPKHMQQEEQEDELAKLEKALFENMNQGLSKSAPTDSSSNSSVKSASASQDLPEDILPNEIAEQKKPAAKVSLFSFVKLKRNTDTGAPKIEADLPLQDKAVPDAKATASLSLLEKSRDKLLDRKQKLEAEIQSLAETRKAIKTEIDEDQKHLRVLEAQNREKIKEIEDKQKELTYKIQQIAERDKTLSEKQSQHDEIHEAIESKRAEHDEKLGRIKDYEKESRRLEGELARLSSLRDQLKSENDSLRRELNEKEHELNEKEMLLTQEHKRLISAQKELEDSKKEHYEMHNMLTKKKQEVDTKAKSLENFEKNISELESQVAKLRMQKEQLEIEIATTEEIISSKQSEKTGISSEIQKMTAELSRAKAELTKTKTDLGLVSKDLKVRQAELDKKSRLLDSATKKLEKSRIDPEAKDVLFMLDELLGKLPENAIDDFSASQGYEKYEKLMARYGKQ